MLGINAKRAIESTFERVFKSTGGRFESVTVVWGGSTAGVKYSTYDHTCNLLLPPIDDLAEINQQQLNQFIGYALHELGHCWFTQNAPWDAARAQGGQFLSNLINGLEDPRIEQAVIASGYAGNAAALFESLTNAVLTRDGYVHPDDIRNVPFQLAIEGRRLNGYRICVPPVWEDSIYRLAIGRALADAHKATSTAEIVEIAQRLLADLQQQQQQQQQEQQQEQQQAGDDQAGDDQAGDQSGDQGGDQSGDQAGDQAGDRGGDQSGGQSGDQAGDQSGDQSDGQAGDQQGGDQQGGEDGEGIGHSSSFGDERAVEPHDFIKSSFGELIKQHDRPRLG